MRTRIRECTEDLSIVKAKLDRLHDKSIHTPTWLPSIAIFVGLLAVACAIYAAGLTVAEDRLQSIVTERLLTFAKDRTGLRNFAHAFTGADIIHPLTSPTFSSGDQPPDAVPWKPETVLTPGLEAGRCWSFAGSSGHIAISLADRIMVTNITIEHISLALAPQSDTVPKDMILWGLVDDRVALERYKSLAIQSNDLFTSTIFPISNSGLPHQMHADSFVPLVSFTYDPYTKDSLQTFSIPSELLGVEVPVRHVVVDVRTNWGNKLRTCLYRVRVHGLPMH